MVADILTVNKSNSLLISDLVQLIHQQIDFQGKEPLYSLREAGTHYGRTLLELVIFYSLDSGHDYQIQLWRGGVFDATHSITRNYAPSTFHYTANRKDFATRYGALLAIKHPIINRTTFFNRISSNYPKWGQDQLDPELSNLLAITAGILEQDRTETSHTLQPKELREEKILTQLNNAIEQVGYHTARQLGPERLAWLVRSKQMTAEIIQTLNDLPTSWLEEVFTMMLDNRQDLFAVSVPDLSRPDGVRKLVDLQKV